MLYAFAEGELASEHESSLFAGLASDSSLRAEFKKLMILNAGIKENSSLFKKDEKTKKAVFTTLGLTIPTGIGAGLAGSSLSSGATGVSAALISMKTAIITAVLSAIGAGVFVYFFMGNSDSNNTGNNFGKQETTAVSTFDEAKPEEDSMNDDNKNSLVNSEEANKIGKKAETVIKYVYVPIEKAENHNVQNDNITDNISEQRNKYDDEANDFMNKPVRFSGPVFIRKADYSQAPFSSMQENELYYSKIDMTDFKSLFYDNDEEIFRMSVEWRGIENQMFGNSQMENAQYPNFNNNMIAVIWGLSDDFHFGLELRSETFHLQFNGIENGIRYNYEQQPDFITFSGLFRYKFNYFNSWAPFAQVNFGGNQIGFVGRTTIGIDYSLLNNFSIIAGLEYSNMFYQFKGVGFNSNRIGLTYGVSYKF